MSSTPKYELVDRVLGGQLAAKLSAWRSDGVSYEMIAQRLRTEHDIAVSTATVCRWVSSMRVPAGGES